MRISTAPRASQRFSVLFVTFERNRRVVISCEKNLKKCKKKIAEFFFESTFFLSLFGVRCFEVIVVNAYLRHSKTLVVNCAVLVVTRFHIVLFTFFFLYAE